MDARAERLRINELQGPPISPVLEEALPAPQDYRMDHQPELVQEPLFEQRPHEGAAADDRDVLAGLPRSEEHTSELQSRQYLVCRLLLEKKKIDINTFDY